MNIRFLKLSLFIAISLTDIGCSTLGLTKDEPGPVEENITAFSSPITLGMTADDVVAAWGTPAKTEYSGDPRRGNERWIYANGLSDQWGLSKPRVVYFENHHVAGWDTPERH